MKRFYFSTVKNNFCYIQLGFVFHLQKKSYIVCNHFFIFFSRCRKTSIPFTSILTIFVFLFLGKILIPFIRLFLSLFIFIYLFIFLIISNNTFIYIRKKYYIKKLTVKNIFASFFVYLMCLKKQLCHTNMIRILCNVYFFRLQNFLRF